MNLLHVAPVHFGKNSGIAVSVPGLISAQNKLATVSVSLLNTSHCKSEHASRFPMWRYNDTFRRNGLNSLPSPFNAPDLVVFHSTYIPEHVAVARSLRKRRIPYVIVPRGGFTKGARQTKFLKKRIGDILLFNSLFANACAVHFLTEGERHQSKTWGRPSFVLGNGIDIPSVADMATPGKDAGLRFVFVGRLDIITKGLDLLLEACALSRRRLQESGATVALYGPDINGSTREIREMIADYDLNNLVSLHDPIDDEAKKAVFGQADVFVHTSRFEGHPMAVLEALAYGVPCLVTPGTNMGDDVEKHNAGWMVLPTASAIADGICTILSRKDDLPQNSMGARSLAVAEYDWCQIARLSIMEYDKILQDDH